ncbi:TerB family tellurite resistance protein [Flavobacteriaceae bacterium TP-CH-4]|uniref:TerB family tellurite resistance protein n=1 Tax=Pelagihabitans pacificus TaxID=2696054 RepID=A0A967EFM8_9FLAO|nr:TerB family tellurite resistance protein [Pelagihabitans pacificus]NHF61578.1 TerB family tellurite resistance protein [Pelagihabitans pacificus]
MSIADRYDSGEHQSNIAHFAAIVKLANVDGIINTEEEVILKRLAFKLDVSDETVKDILKNPGKFPLIPPYSLEERIERLQDLCSIILADHEIEEEERTLIYKYAIGLGFSNGRAKEEIQKCINVLKGNEKRGNR